MRFSTNYDDIGGGEGFAPLPPGEYETVITNIEEKQTGSGAVGLNISLCIRNDVSQKYQNRYTFLTYWKRKEPEAADMQVQGYSFKQIMRLAKSARLPSGKAYENVMELCRDLMHRPLRITLMHDTYNGKVYERVQYVNESKFPEVKHTFKDKQSAASTNQPSAEPTVPKAAETYGGDLSNLEEILSDGDIPF